MTIQYNKAIWIKCLASFLYLTNAIADKYEYLVKNIEAINETIAVHLISVNNQVQFIIQ